MKRFVAFTMCRFFGHQRRKFVSENAERRIVACPRCGDELVYKKAKAGTLKAVA